MAAALAGVPVDRLAQPLQWRRKRLSVADIDSTAIAVECIDQLADFAGIRAAVAAITGRCSTGWATGPARSSRRHDAIGH